MKKSRLLAIAMSALLAISATAVPMASYAIGSISGTTEEMLENGCFLKTDIWYNGIVITMEDDTVPTAEGLGIENRSICTYTGSTWYWTSDPHGLDTTDAPKNTYWLLNEDTTEEPNEDADYELCKELVLSGKVKNAQLGYTTSKSEGWLNHIYVNFPEDIDDAKALVPELDNELFDVYNYGIAHSSWWITLNKDVYDGTYAELNYYIDDFVDEINSKYGEQGITASCDISYLVAANTSYGLVNVPAGITGDANENNSTDIADVVAIRRYAMNPEKYPLSETGLEATDVVGNNDGVNAQDAVAVQKMIMGITE